MATFQKFHSFTEAVTEKAHNLGSDNLKVMLCLVAPLATNSVKADVTEIAPGNGYTAGGNTATQASSAQTSGLYKLVLNDPATWTAAGGPIAAFRYAVLYNNTAASQELIGFWDYGSSVNLVSGDSFTVDFSPTNGVLTLS